MGTSKSSSGSPGGVPMVPPWTPDPLPPPPAPPDGPPGPAPDGDPDGGPDAAPDLPSSPSQPGPIAPPARFGSSRTSLGRYARSGSTGEMRKGVGHCVSKGWGGSNTATRRLSGTARSAGVLYGALSTLATGQPSEAGGPLDRVVLTGRSANDIMRAVVEAVRPVDGTQDAEATRDAIKGAASELLAKNPDADFLALSEQDRLFMVERFLANDIFNHLVLDIGQAIQKNAPTASAASARFREIKNYVRQAISAAFRKIHKSGEALTARRVSAISRQCIQEAMEVFEGGAE